MHLQASFPRPAARAPGRARPRPAPEGQLPSRRLAAALAAGLALVLCAFPPLMARASAPAAATGPSSAAPVPATRFYPLVIGNHWDYAFHRLTAFSLTTVDGKDRSFNLTTEGDQAIDITRQDGERSDSHGKVVVQKTMETAHTGNGPGASDQDTTAKPPAGPHLVGESYFRINDRGIWLIADGEPDDKGESIAKVTDRRLPLLWLPPDLAPDQTWTITCQIDTSITARLTARVGKAQRLKVGGATYDNCLPVVNVADQLRGRLDVGVGLAPIRDGRLIDITWYAPGIGVVRSHQLANFDLEPPNAGFSAASAHFEENQDLEPGFKAGE